MRRFYILPLLLLLSLTGMIVMAQEDLPLDVPTPVSPIIPDEPADNLTNGNHFIPLNSSPLVIKAGEGADLCENAVVIDTGQGGTQFDAADMTQSVDDPILNCMWGSPSSLQGYRTVWYQFTPDFNGIMTLSTLPASSLATNAYDTVLAVHTGSCGSLTTLACNDDLIGFSSTLTMNIRRNVTYYIEVADWQAGGNAIKMLDISLQIENYNTLWQTVDTNSFTQTSRHASVVIGSDVYFLGGRNGNGNLLNNFQKLDANTGDWTQLAPIRGGGFLNTTAVYLPSTHSIYLPGGSIQSSDQAYSRDHQIYNFNTGIWSTASEPVGGDNVTEAFAYAAAAPNNANDGYFLTGGIVGPSLVVTSTVRDQVLFYQPDSDEWIAKKEMTSPRYGHVAANVGGKLCVAGGLNTDGSINVLIPDGECADSGISPSSWASIGNMNVPRYYAHSSVGPDGRWYIYGGIDGTGAVVPEVDVYDPVTKSWSVLSLYYDLGGQDGKPVVWPGGGFVGNYLWMAGGSYDPTGDQTNPQVAKVQILEDALYLPLILNNQNANNHSFSDALNVSFFQTISQNFSSSRTLVNVYKFNQTQVNTVNVALTGVASDASLNLYLYGENKDLIQSDETPFVGYDKSFTMPLGPGTYYVVVRYAFGTEPNAFDDYYQLRVSK